jgi:hypothetical protein
MLTRRRASSRAGFAFKTGNEQFVPDYNARFAVSAAEPGSAFIAYVGRPLEDVLCIQEDRVVGADNCVSWKRRSRFRLNSIAGTMCAPPCGCMNIPTAGSPSSTAHAVLQASTEGSQS